MTSKFIPARDITFAAKAHAFTTLIAKEPARFGVSDRDLELLQRADKEFRLILQRATSASGKNPVTTANKRKARHRLEVLVRKYGAVIRADPHLTEAEKIALGVATRPSRLRRRDCPQTRPILEFLGGIESPRGAFGYSAAALNGNPAGTLHGCRHRLNFRNDPRPTGSRPWIEGMGTFGGKAKPDGAARIELFIGFVHPHEAIPESPGQMAPGSVAYLRSFSRGPFDVEFPLPSSPMMVVYWGRWANAVGEVGPFSKTLCTRLEGWTGATLVGATGGSLREGEGKAITAARDALNAAREGIDGERARRRVSVEPPRELEASPVQRVYGERALPAAEHAVLPHALNEPQRVKAEQVKAA